MTLLIVFLVVLVALVALFVVAILLAGFRPQRSRRPSHRPFSGPGGDSGGTGTTP